MIEIKNVNKSYKNKNLNVEALRNISIHVGKGDIFGIIGYSGAGKSTLIRCINLLERPDSGEVIVNGIDITKISEKNLRMTRQKIGMIFQHFNLLKYSTVYENVAFPLFHTEITKTNIKKKVYELLELVGLTDKALSYPSQLSGGQKQRVAIARALANDPQILLSDEATSALDPQTTESILNLLGELNKKLDLTVVIITHEMNVIKEICNRVAVIDDGQIVEQGTSIELFTAPKHPTTRKFVDSLFKIENVNKLLKDANILKIIGDDGIVARLIFKGISANNAYISDISIKFGIEVSIIYGNIESIQGEPIGSLFVIFRGERNKVTEAIQHLKKEDVDVFIILNNAHERKEPLKAVIGQDFQGERVI